MNILILGTGKTGSLVAQVARERGHSVRTLDINENEHASALTAPTLALIDVVIDFTAPAAALENIRACLANNARIVVGTTGWYAHLPELTALAARHTGALLWGSNFSIGVQKFFQLTAALGRLQGYQFSISETHHITKLDAPSGTALSLKGILEAAQPGITVPVESHRVGDASGLHVVTATSPADTITLTHDASNRRGFAEGAVRAAEWLAANPSATSQVLEFRQVAPEVMAGEL